VDKTKKQWDLSDEKLKELRDSTMAAWEYLHGAVSDIVGSHGIFFDYPIKSPSLEVYDNLYGIFEVLKEKVAADSEPAK
jgi:hypothetical protein